jgi:6-pyruvoyltetrahydropterin/6-carboxytetrahydropterin synthase
MPKYVYLTRRERFNAAHKLWVEDWTQEENFKNFGKCANPNWQGHNYELFVTVKGEPSPVTGFCMDLKWLSKLIQEKIVEALDHKNINLDVPFMEGLQSSTENLAITIWEQLEQDINQTGCILHSIRIHETENNFVEYFGGN